MKKYLICLAAFAVMPLAAQACDRAAGVARRAVSRTVAVVRVRPVVAVPVGAFYLPPPVLVAPKPMPAVAPPKVAAPPAVKSTATTTTTTKTTATSSVTVKPAVRRTLLPRLFPVRGCEGGNCPAR